jgi:thioredoxin reductase
MHGWIEVALLIVGGGPAGVASGVCAGAEGLSAVVVEDISVVRRVRRAASRTTSAFRLEFLAAI